MGTSLSHILWNKCIEIHRTSHWSLAHGKHSGEAQLLSCVQLLVTPWTVAHQAPLTIEFSRQEYWSELPFLTPGSIQRMLVIYKE